MSFLVQIASVIAGIITARPQISNLFQQRHEEFYWPKHALSAFLDDYAVQMLRIRAEPKQIHGWLVWLRDEIIKQPEMLIRATQFYDKNFNMCQSSLGREFGVGNPHSLLLAGFVHCGHDGYWATLHERAPRSKPIRNVLIATG